MDKDHYNTLELISHPEKSLETMDTIKFSNIFLIIIGLISFKIIFYINKKNNLFRFSMIFFLILLIQVLNSYLIYL